MDGMVEKKNGFARMTPYQVRELARQGGLAAHRKGAGRQITVENARAIGALGGRRTAELSRDNEQIVLTKAVDVPIAWAPGAMVLVTGPRASGKTRFWTQFVQSILGPGDTTPSTPSRLVMASMADVLHGSRPGEFYCVILTDTVESPLPSPKDLRRQMRGHGIQLLVVESAGVFSARDFDIVIECASVDGVLRWRLTRSRYQRSRPIDGVI